MSIIQPDNDLISKAYCLIYHNFWRVMIGTWLSVPASYFINGIVISKMKIIFSGRCFFVRYIAGSMITQAALLLTAYPVSLSGKFPPYDLINIILTTWSYKVFISIFLLPLAALLAFLVKRVEKIDHYDWGGNYNPFLDFLNRTNKETT